MMQTYLVDHTGVTTFLSCVPSPASHPSILKSRAGRFPCLSCGHGFELCGHGHASVPVHFANVRDYARVRIHIPASPRTSVSACAQTSACPCPHVLSTGAAVKLLAQTRARRFSHVCEHVCVCATTFTSTYSSASKFQQAGARLRAFL